MIPAHTFIKRTEVNRLIREAMVLMKKSSYPVPSWFYWTILPLKAEPWSLESGIMESQV